MKSFPSLQLADFMLKFTTKMGRNWLVVSSSGAKIQGYLRVTVLDLSGSLSVYFMDFMPPHTLHCSY